jgi:hypothetical protein
MAHIREEISVYRVLVGNPDGKGSFTRPSRRWHNNMRVDLKEVDGKACTGFIWVRIGTSDGLLCHGNEPSSSIQCEEFFCLRVDEKLPATQE